MEACLLVKNLRKNTLLRWLSRHGKAIINCLKNDELELKSN